MSIQIFAIPRESERARVLKKTHSIQILFFFFILFFPSNIFCQQDSVQTKPSLSADSVRVAGDNQKEFRMAKSPLVAVGLSAILPGAGQIYTKNYWKAPVILGLGGYWVYEWIKLNNNYKDFRDRYYASIQAFPPNGDGQLLKDRDFYHDERDKFAWFLGGLYFLNLVDAYVGAHLYDFEVTPDLTENGNVVPKVIATVRFTF